MTVDRPFVGGGLREAPGTCVACCWGRGPHAEGCSKRPLTSSEMWEALKHLALFADDPYPSPMQFRSDPQ